MRLFDSVVHISTYQVVWCPKYRKPVLIDEVKSDLEKVIRQLVDEKDVNLIAMNIQPDYVHLTVDVHPQYGIGEFVTNAKGRSARHLRANHPHLKTVLPTLWTKSYLVVTGDTLSPEALNEYVSNQKKRGER